MSDYFGDALKKRRGEDSETEKPLPPAGNLTVPEDSDIQPGAIRASQPKPQKIPSEDYTPDGTYVPRSGGRRGWFENSAILANERDNNYRFFAGIDREAFNKAILDAIEPANRRGAVRVAIRLPLRFAVADAAEPAEREVGFSADLSMTGARIRVRTAVEMTTSISVAFHPEVADAEEAVPRLAAQATVMWCRQAPGSQASPRYYLGLRFDDLDISQKQRLADILSGGKPLLE